MSVYWDLLNDALSQIRTKATFSGYLATQYAVRSRPFCSPEHGDSLPFLCLAGEWESLEQGWDHFDSAVGISYPVMVAWFLAKGSEVQDANRMQLVYQGREEIRNALWQPKVFSTLQVDAKYDPNPPFDRMAMDRQYHLSLQRFVFTYAEER